ncbi:MAG TPA: hypothetical protein VGD38_06965 [Pyrinomonadaceae bacterium]
MKRCPQCEFIYEDDQSLCDMDGALLVFDSRSLPNLHALAPVDVPAARVAHKAHWRHRTFPAMAALILATVLSLVYFVTSQRGGSPVNVPAVNLPASNLVTPAAAANPTPEPPPATEASGAAPASTASASAAKEQPETTKAAATAPARKATSKTSTTTQPKPAPEAKKDDSKVGSILKKTGRILKKPFKL